MREALIYAAGFGTRMKELTASKPKPLLTVNGKALIDYSVDLLRSAGVEMIHVNAAYLSDQLEDHFKGQTAVEVHTEADGPYETGGTLKSLAQGLPDVIMTINSDVIFTDQNGPEILKDHWKDDLDALLLCVPRKKAIAYHGKGDFYLNASVPEWKGQRDEAPYVFTGLQIIRPKLAFEFEEKVFSNREIWLKALERGRMRAVSYEGGWIDVGTKESLYEAEREIACSMGSL